MADVEAVSLSLPIVIPLLAAVACVLVRRGRRRQYALGLVGALLHVAAALWLFVNVQQQGVLATHLGDWSPPFGIALAADRFSALMLVLASLIAGLCAVFAVSTLRGVERITTFMRLLHLMVAGLSGLFLTTDLFNFYVWFELVLICSFGMMVITGRRAAIEGATKYFVINALGSMLLLACTGLLYGLTGTLTMADIAERVAATDRPHLVTAVGALLLVALGIKSAAFPLFFWLPASYHTPPIAVTALFGGLLTKVGVYGIMRLFTLIFTADVAYMHSLILIIGALTMITGVLGAVAQNDLRRLFSFHIISQIGYMLVGIGLFTVAGLAAAIYFMVHIVITKTALFFASGAINCSAGSFQLDRLGGLYERSAVLSALFLLPALSISGIPPFSGFPAKLAIVQAGFAEGRHLIVAAVIAVSLLTFYSMTKIWTQAFWSPAPNEQARIAALPVTIWMPALVLCVLALALGLAAGPMMEFAAAAANDLMQPTDYTNAVMGRSGS